jgi:pyrimidine 5'-nucleotidase
VTQREFETWVFDLDNTLYPATVDLFSQIDMRMKAYISQLLDLPPEEAFRLQKHYYNTYGTSLRGLMVEHHVDPADFLAHVHDIDHGVLSLDPELDAALSRIKGRNQRQRQTCPGRAGGHRPAPPFRGHLRHHGRRFHPQAATAEL